MLVFGGLKKSIVLEAEDVPEDDVPKKPGAEPDENDSKDEKDSAEIEKETEDLLSLNH